MKAYTEVGTTVLDPLFFENHIKSNYDIWLNTGDAARVLSMTENALRMMSKTGQIPSYKIGRRLRFKLRDCYALIRKNE